MRHLCIFWLYFAAQAAWAIGDSAGGCPRPDALLGAARDGTPAQLQAAVETHIDQLRRQPSHRFSSQEDRTGAQKNDPAWRARVRRQVLNDALHCTSSRFLLDEAVAGGNLPNVDWLLNAGADPSGTRQDRFAAARENLFHRCRFAPSGQKTVSAATQEALRYLVRRGAQPNATLDGELPRNALTQCDDDAMLPTLLALGVSRSPARPPDHRRQSLHSLWPAPRYAPLQQAVLDHVVGRGSLERVKLLAGKQFNDLRGTVVEGYLAGHCWPSEVAANPAKQQRCEQVLRVVQVNPALLQALKITDGWAARQPAPLAREACVFPEILTTPAYAVKAVYVPDAYAGAASAPQVIVNVQDTPAPTVLLLSSRKPVRWTVRQAQGTQLLGIIAESRDSGLDPGPMEVSPQGVPFLLGSCLGNFGNQDKGYPLLSTYNANPSVMMLDPLLRTHDKQTFIVRDNTLSIGMKAGEKSVQNR
ncbi:hypothetical protein [Ottowia testudinis]|uniref:Ankyrin repeat protein n=1 Tax=Ottowia testudinis TaxID=2816950 RepID=A0A975CFU6_9BURK|nr:hypothetical protein [Ottowia testudinis]QTD45430.1 hypothetical protein J1M35_00410 [Ottowia testudinis]